MKALKERRTSLRSLVRRGLVILSLFALVFAVSCGGSEGSSSSPGDGGEDLPATTRKVVEMKVLASPSIYSFQGQAPDLTGLVVEVRWSDGTTYEQITDTTQFYTVPTTIEWASDGPTNNLALFHNSNKELYTSFSIPRVVRIDTAYLTGKGAANETIYEDEGIVTTGMTLNAIYEAIPEQPVTGHRATGGTYKWDAVTTKQEKQLPVYGSADRWVFDGADARIAQYIYAPGYWTDDDDDGVVETFSGEKRVPFQFDNYYFVDKIVVNNTGTFDKFAADDTVYVNPGSLTGVARENAASAWLDLLEDAGVTFDVHYYDNPTVKTKTMADYKRAYSMRDTWGEWTPKASYPVLSYNNFALALDEGTGLNVFLQYYDKKISAIGGPSAPENTEPKPNQMMITFPPESILENTGVIARWKLSTEPYNPEVIASSSLTPGTGGTQADLITALGTYYDVFRIYGEGADAIEVKIPFDSNGSTPGYGDGWGGFPFSEFDNKLNEGGTAIMMNQPFIMAVPNPRSLGGNVDYVAPWDNDPARDFEWTFLYDLHPPKTDTTP